MDKKTVEIIEEILKRGDRVELIPVKDGVRIYAVKRREISKNKDE